MTCGDHAVSGGVLGVRGGAGTARGPADQVGGASRCVVRRLRGTGPVAGGTALQRAPLVLAHGTPDAGVLAGLQGPLQALVHDLATAADGAGLLDLQEGRS